MNGQQDCGCIYLSEYPFVRPCAFHMALIDFGDASSPCMTKPRERWKYLENLLPKPAVAEDLEK